MFQKGFHEYKELITWIASIIDSLTRGYLNLLKPLKSNGISFLLFFYLQNERKALQWLRLNCLKNYSCFFEKVDVTGMLIFSLIICHLYRSIVLSLKKEYYADQTTENENVIRYVLVLSLNYLYYHLYQLSSDSSSHIFQTINKANYRGD